VSTGTNRPIRPITARSESADGARTLTEYPGTFSAMMLPSRSKMVPRGAVSEIGRSRLVSARSWNFSCWMTWVLKNAPARSTNVAMRTSWATSARSRTR
jgi:hypothetical protein